MNFWYFANVSQGDSAMSGGIFGYSDNAARWQVDKELEYELERLSGDYSSDAVQVRRNAELLRAVSVVFFEWLHDYDLASSGDTGFDQLDELVAGHVEQLLSLLKD